MKNFLLRRQNIASKYWIDSKSPFLLQYVIKYEKMIKLKYRSNEFSKSKRIIDETHNTEKMTDVYNEKYFK